MAPPPGSHRAAGTPLFVDNPGPRGTRTPNWWEARHHWCPRAPPSPLPRPAPIDRAHPHHASRRDLLIATLGKALGVNGGYVVGTETLVAYLRETSPFYVYSNPITPGEAAAATRAVEILDSAAGRDRIAHLHAMTERFRDGLIGLGHETIPGLHPAVPLMVRDPARTRDLVEHLRLHGVLATGLHFPVVPRGEDEIRSQISADHTPGDIDEALAALSTFPGSMFSRRSGSG